MRFNEEFLQLLKEDFKNTIRTDCRLFIIIVRMRIYLYQHFRIPLLRPIFRILSEIVYFIVIRVLCNSEISKSVVLGGGFGVFHPYNIFIGDTIIGKNFCVGHETAVGYAKKNGIMGLPTIGDNVLVGIGAKIIGPVKVGDNARIGVNSVVYEDIPAYGKVFNNVSVKLMTEVEA